MRTGMTDEGAILAGADGYHGAWVVATESEGGATSLHLLPSLHAILSLGPTLNTVVIDVPIGLLDSGRRECDAMARKLLGPRRNSVFTAPLRPMLSASTWEEACSIRYRIEEKRCSKQAFGILPLVRATDEAMHPALQRRVREGHPEVSFTLLSGAPMKHHKSRPAGIAERRSVLEPHFPDMPERIREFGRPGALTDILDAYVLLWTARRILQERAQVLTSPEDIDDRGLRAEIVA